MLLTFDVAKYLSFGCLSLKVAYYFVFEIKVNIMFTIVEHFTLKMKNFKQFHHFSR